MKIHASGEDYLEAGYCKSKCEKVRCDLPALPGTWNFLSRVSAMQ